MLRFEENCVPLSGIPEKLLTDSKVSLLAFDGNMFNQKAFQDAAGYDKVSLLFHIASYELQLPLQSLMFVPGVIPRAIFLSGLVGYVVGVHVLLF